MVLKKKKSSRITCCRNKTGRQPFQNTAELKNKENKQYNLQETENKEKETNIKPESIKQEDKH